MTAQTAPRAPQASDTPSLTRAQILAFVAFAIFVALAVAAHGKHRTGLVRPGELAQVRKFTIFFIAALLPSDALIRFGRNLLYTTVEDASAAAAAAPATTLAQLLAFAAFLTVAALTLFSTAIVSGDQFAQVNEVARTLVVALLPSQAAVHFGRALYYRSPQTPQPGATALKRI